jgi:hypothetical protein
MARRDDVWSQMNALGTSKNLVSGYDNPFEFGDMNSYLDSIYGEYENKLNRNVSKSIATEQGGAASRMASRGITGGSVVDDTMSGIASGINEKKFNALSDLGIGKAGQTMDLQKFFDQIGLTQLGMEQNQENTIQGQKANKLGMLGNYLTEWEASDIAQQNQPGFLEDMFSVIGDVSSLVPGIGTAISLVSKVAGGATVASDKRLKENFVLVGVDHGINIYRFNFKGIPDKIYEGVIAQEVQNIRPEAVHDSAGILSVDYDLIGIKFREV